MGSIPITRSIPTRRQASCGNSSDGKYLIAWEISWELRGEPARGNCHCLPLVAPAFARSFALGPPLYLQVRIRDIESNGSIRDQPITRH